MLTFKQFITESNWMKRIVPAVRHYKTKHLIRGKRGDLHRDVMFNYNLKRGTGSRLGPTVNFRNYDEGFYDPVTRKFFKDKVYGKTVDSTDLMTPTQLARKELGSVMDW